MAKLSTKQSGATHIPHISIVVPLFNEEESLRELFSLINETMRQIKMSYEIIFVDDGSTDKSFEVLTALHIEYPKIIKAIRFRRNYGKSAALSAGFKEAQGEFIITMDADLQDDPNEIPSLIEALGD
ncbi:MAG: glycosyltransferase family 2 protein, partial [Bacteroidota bacterium]